MCSVYTGEMFAIYRAVKVLNGDNKTFAICSDSLGAIQAIKDPYSSNPLIQNIQDDIHTLSTNYCKIHLVWISSHIGITGNEFADSSAGNAACSQVIEQHFYLPKDVNKYFKVTIESKWQNLWNVSNTKLSRIEPSLLSFKQLQLNRKYPVAIRRLRIGHTRLTHGHLMERTCPPKCDRCNVLLTVDHIITKCPMYSANRISFQIKDELRKNLHSTVDQRTTIEFLKSINIFNSI
ncbi:uncharacterized protein [Euwallacea fornicatus]|uniref:uncharacterized protein n=1 Tax=Euwallacea fornicatus TaxID=995702 RepID=UPI00338EADCE